MDKFHQFAVASYKQVDLIMNFNGLKRKLKLRWESTFYGLKSRFLCATWCVWWISIFSRYWPFHQHQKDVNWWMLWLHIKHNITLIIIINNRSRIKCAPPLSPFLFVQSCWQEMDEILCFVCYCLNVLMKINTSMAPNLVFTVLKIFIMTDDDDRRDPRVCLFILRNGK